MYFPSGEKARELRDFLRARKRIDVTGSTKAGKPEPSLAVLTAPCPLLTPKPAEAKRGEQQLPQSQCYVPSTAHDAFLHSLLLGA